MSIDDQEFTKRSDPVARQVSSLTAEEVVEWLVKYHGLQPSSADTVTSNLRSQFRWHRLQGRLDQRPTAALIAQLLLMRQSVKALETPPKPSDGDHRA